MTNSAPLTFTTNAAKRVQHLVAEENKPNLKLRVYIQGGGCSGFQYGFQFDEVQHDDDTAVETEGMKLVVDPLSYQYLAGAEIDYKDDLMGARFIVINPNAQTTCGCGASFSV